MKKIIFFAKCILLLSILFIFAFGIVMPQYGCNYQASLIDKNARLKSIDEPKIVLVGNSNLAFGIDSKKIEDAFGMPVVNMGLHGGAGNVFNEQAAVQNVKKGDIVIISYSRFSDGDKLKNPELAWITIEDHPELYSYIRLKDWPDMIHAYPTYLKDCLLLWADGMGNKDSGDEYSRIWFNEYGDNVYDRPSLMPDTDFSEVGIPEIGDDTIGRLNKLNERLTKEGATMLIAAYPIPVTEGTPSAEEYTAFKNELDAKLDAPVISDYTSYMMDKELFYNTYLHLNNTGVQVRTDKLIADLNAYMQQSM